MSSFKRLFFIFLLISSGSFSFSQTGNGSWQVDYEGPKSFIQNKGQFDGRNWQKDTKIEYGVDYNKAFIFFTKKGLTYRFDKIIRNPNRKKGEIDDSNPKRTNISELIHVNWIGANQNPEIVAEDLSSDYFSYAIKNLTTKEVRNENQINGYKKITYKNLYDKVDVVYVIQPEGIKYSIILHPGADVSQIKMKYYTGHTSIANENIECNLDENGEIQIKTSLSEIVEHKPFTFYKKSKQEIKSNFKFENNILSFNLEEYNNSKEVVIDPWVQSPAFSTSTAVWEVETDAVGNVYVIGGETPMQLKKYSSAGVIQWTYTTPWDTASVWLGTLATDNTGVSYITSGTSPEIERINNAGGMVWHQNGSGFSDEYWSITFNCDKTKLIVGGTILNMLLFKAWAAIFNIDLSNGNVLNSQTLAVTNIAGIGASPIEVRSISSSKNAKYIFLTHNQVGAINQNIGSCPTNAPVFQLDNGHHLGYKCENYLPATQNGGGLKALIANDQYFYTHSGNQIHKRLLGNGSLVTSVNLTGGNSTTVPMIGGKVVHNSGLAVDDCGNVYAGSGDRVVKFDADLNFISDALLPFTVYDVSVNSNGEVIAVGAQSDNQAANRNGKIQSVNLSACAQFALICCDANICIPDTFCLNDPAVNLTPSSPGGVWSGVGITNAANGTFNPSVAGVGVHTVYYSLACGSDSISIVVSPCVSITACQETNGNITVSDGVPVYNWQEYIAAVSTPITNAAECTACGGTWTPFVNICMVGGFPVSNCNTPASWSSLGTGTTVTPGTNYPILVTDAVGTTLTITSLASLPMCSSCPTLVITPANIVNATCGNSNGSFSVTTTAGSSPYDYILFDGLSNVVATFNNVAGSQSFTGLSSGTFTLMVTDNSGCTGSTTVTITASGGIIPTISGATSFCTGGSTTLDAGAGYTNYLWSTGATNQTINVTTANTYSVTVTDGAGCTGVASVSVTVNTSLSPTVTGNNFCVGSNTTLDAGSGYVTYLWSTGGNTQTISVNTAGNYIVTVTNASGCTGTGQLTVSTNALPTPTITGNLTFCNGATSILDAGAGYLFYNWSTSAVTQTISVSAAGNYSVSVTDANGCIGSTQVTVNVNPSLTPTISGATSFCTAGSTVLDAGTGYAGYLWSTGSLSQTITVTTAGTYSVTVANASGCTGIASVVVTVNSSLSPVVTGNNFCAGNGSTLDAGSGYSTYLWSTGATTQTISVFAVNTYYVTVTNATGCSGTGQIVINQNANPTSSITGNLSICAGFSTTLNAGAGYASYFWSTTAVTPTISVNTPGSYSVTVTDNNGCTGTSLVTVTLSSGLNPTISGSLQMCSGSSTVLNAGNGYAGYIWSNGMLTQSVSVNTAGNYSVTVSDASGCSGVASVTLVVNPNPTPLITGNLSMCSGDTTYLDAGSGFSTYSWSSANNTQSIAVGSSGVYTVTVSNVFGCTGTSSVTVNETNGVLLSAVPLHNICNGEWAYLTATASGGSAPFTYYWNNVISPASIGVQPVASTTYQAYVVDVNGCVSNIVSVLVNVSPPLQVDVMASPTSICPNESTVLNVSINQGGVPPFTIFTSSGQIVIPPISISPTVSGFQYLYVKDGCGSISHDSVYITVNASPLANFVSDTVNGCEPLTVSFTPMNPLPGQTYLWNFGDLSYNAISYDINPVHQFSQDGIFDVTLTVTNASGCLTTYTHSDMINVYPNPDASFITDPIYASIVKPQIHFINLSEGADSYIWSFGDGDSSSIENPWHWYSSLGAYHVYLVAITDLGCTDTVFSSIYIRDEYTFYAPTYISPDYDELNDVFYVLGNGISSEDFHLYIFDRWGEIIYETDKYDPTQPEKYGWDGTANGHAIVPIGSYTWLVKYYDGDHIEHDRSGVVNVVR